MNQELDPEQRGQGENESTVRDIVLPHRDIEPLRDAEIDKLIELLSQPTQALTNHT